MRSLMFSVRAVGHPVPYPDQVLRLDRSGQYGVEFLKDRFKPIVLGLVQGTAHSHVTTVDLANREKPFLTVDALRTAIPQADDSFPYLLPAL